MFIPIGDDNSRRYRFPYVVWIILAINVFAWFLELNLGERFMMAFAITPFEISHGIDLTTTRLVSIRGESYPIEHSAGPSPIQLTLLTSMFLHGSWGHIIGNMLYLLIFGDQIEDRLGHFKFTLFYIAAGLAAGLAQVITDPNSILPCVGASGAIAGVLGAYLVLYPHNSVRVLVFGRTTLVPAILVLGAWWVMQVMGHLGNPTQEGGVAYMAHIGGFVVGVVLGILSRFVTTQQMTPQLR
jgi:membrane associated rhomboid family serine protease